MTLFRLPLIVLLAMMVNLATPFAMGSTEAFDKFEEAVHRPRNHAAVRLVRDLPASKVVSRVPSVSVRLFRRAGKPARLLMTGQSNRKIPPPVGDTSPDEFDRFL